MTVLFIADLHLREKESDSTAGFLHFLQKEATQAKALYILGDFFDYWIGDDDPNLLHKIIAKELKKLKNQGILCYFIHGNRDFLLGKKFAKESGMILLPREKTLILHGYNILILHGDILCTNDVNYQCYRKHAQNHWLQRLFLILPLSVRYFIAEKIRKESQNSIQIKQNYIIDVNAQTVTEKFKKYQVDWIIHGHTHRPGIHKFHINDRILYRAVLGSWVQTGSVIKVTKKGIHLLDFPF